MNRIRELREEKAMTQYQLGKQLNVQNTTISMYEREERHMDPPTVDKMCSFFECTSDYLLGRSEVRNPIMTDEEAILLRSYRAASEKDRRLVDTILEEYKDRK